MILLLSFDVRRQGGIERLTLQVKRSLEPQGELVVLLCPQRLGPGALGRQLGRLGFLLKLAWYLPRARQILCMHALMLRPVLWLRKLGRKKQPLICWLHGIEVWGSGLQQVEGSLQQCSGLIASSSFTRNQVLESAEKRMPISHVVHPMADLIDASEEIEPLPDGLRLLTVARMDAGERYKGHRLVLEALRQLKEKGSLAERWQWRVVGTGDDRQGIEQLSQDWGLKPWVRFLGSLSDGELERELRTCSLLLMPSSFEIGKDGKACGEGFGIVYLEAAQAGRASIACKLGGQSDLIANGLTGWLIDPDASELAALLLDLRNRPTDMAAAGNRARERAVNQFSQAAFDQALATALRSC